MRPTVGEVSEKFAVEQNTSNSAILGVSQISFRAHLAQILRHSRTAGSVLGLMVALWSRTYNYSCETVHAPFKKQSIAI